MKQADLIKYHRSTLAVLESSRQNLAATLTQTQLELSTGKLKNVHLPLSLRHDLAKLNTLIHLKQMTEEKISPSPVTMSKPIKKSKKETV
jgi:ribosomal protein L29